MAVISGSSSRSQTAPNNRIAAFILFFAMAGGPLPFGSREETAVAFWCIVLGLGLMVASTRGLRRPHVLVLACVAFIVLCFGFVLHEQLADQPWIATPDPIWAQASEVLGRPLKPSVSIVRGEPFYALGQPLAAVLALLLGLLVGTDHQQARRAIMVVAWSGAAYAVYGIFSLLAEPTMILWRERTAYVGSLTATFLGRNTAASYLGSCAVIWLILLMTAVRGRLPRGPIVWAEAPQHLLARVPRRIVVRFAMLFVCLTGLFLTNSRAGVLISLLLMIVSTVLFFRRDLPSGKGLVLMTVVAGVVALMLLQVMGGTVGYRIDVLGLSDAGRLSAWRSTLHIIADHPWFGTGLGTFAAAFPTYRGNDISMYGVWDRAHSTPLEMAAEVGIPLTGIITVGWIAALVVLSRAAGRGQRAGMIPLCAFSVAMIALLHSSIDFSLQLTGYAIVVFGLLGVGVSQALNDQNNSGSSQRTESS
jgi:O-antigen ligase